MNVKAADAATTTPVAADRGWEMACRCTAAAVSVAPNVANAALAVVLVVAPAAVAPRAVMSERPS